MSQSRQTGTDHVLRLLLAWGCLAWNPAHGAHPLVTEDTGTQGAGGWQLEVNAERTRDELPGGTQKTLLPAATLTYGVAERVDLQLTHSYLRVQGDGRGPLDAALDLKWRFHDEGALSFALKPGITVPTGNEAEGRGTGRATWGALAIVSYELDRWALHGHAGYRENRNVLGERASLWQLAGALWRKSTERWNLVLDLSADTDPGGGRSLRQAVLGVIYLVNRDLDLDAGLRWGNDPALDRALLVGATLRWR